MAVNPKVSNCILHPVVVTSKFQGLICQLMMFENFEMKMMKIKKKKRGNKEKMTILMKMNNFISPGNPKIKSRASENMQESSGPKSRL